MKESLLIAAVIMFAASSVLAVLPPVGLIGVFADTAHDATLYDWGGGIIGGPSYNICPAHGELFPAYIWCLPSERGLHGAEFAIDIPPTTWVVATVKNPLITAEYGSLPQGIGVYFGEGLCQMDWVWLYQLTMIQLGLTTDEARITIVPPYQFVTCQPGFPIEPCNNLVPLYICWPPPGGYVNVEQTNWGAIKSMF